MFKKHFIDILGYIGIGFIGGSISHGFFSGVRSVIMASIGIVLFVLHEYLKESKEKNYIHIVVFGLLYSITIGMISGGLQHFLDSPARSLRIVPIGYFLSYVIFSIHMKSPSFQKNIGTAFLGAIALAGLCIAAYKLVPMSRYSDMDAHHGDPGNTAKDMNCMGGDQGCPCMKGDMSCMQGAGGCASGDMNCMKGGSMGGMMDHSAMSHANVVSEEQFVLDMIPHHQEAVDTSKEIVSRSTNAELKDLAEDIIDAQTKEIATMKEWLKEWYPNSTGTSTYKNMMPNLTIVSGTSLDKLYLQGMMMHHGGAIAMAQGVLALSPREEVKEFANDIIEVQSKEIEIMKGFMMATMPGMNHKMMSK